MLGTVTRAINKVITRFANLLLITMALAVFAQVVFRFILKQPLAWSEEISRYLMIWLTFLGATLAIEKKAHPRVEIFVELLPRRIKQVVHVLVILLSSIFYSLLVYYGAEFMAKSLDQLSPAMGFPMGFVYLVIPVSGLLLILNSLAEIERILKGGN